MAVQSTPIGARVTRGEIPSVGGDCRVTSAHDATHIDAHHLPVGGVVPGGALPDLHGCTLQQFIVDGDPRYERSERAWGKRG